MFKTAMFAAAAIAAIGFSSAGASAAPLGSLARQLDVKALPPIQFQVFCIQSPNKCKPGGAAQVTYTPKLKGLIEKVNTQVNRQITPRNEDRDIWQIAYGPNAEGDCDDFVLTKRDRLIRSGVPASALRIAMVRTKAGEGHAVLIVNTSSGEFVLDNIRKTIVKREQSGYRYFRVSTADPMKWKNY